MDDVEAVLARIAERRPKLIDLSLDRVFAALERLGAPHQKLPPVFHIAGTNGKGSTGAFLRAILEAAGRSAHVYTSPHLVRFNERIVVAGAEISDAALIDALDRCDAAIGEDKLTYFETTTCAAFLAFAETPADFAIIEVGLGGRLDATNVFDAPLATLIAPIGMDHQQFLGDRLSLIAAEKAGIFRRGVPAAIGRQDEEAMAALEERAAEIGAPLFAMGRQWSCYGEHGRLIYQDDNGLSDLDTPRLPGAHQLDNAGLAVAAVKAVELQITNAQISTGLSSARWPARMQRLTNGPLVELARDLLGEEPEIWLDGGHNPHAARAVARAIADMDERRSMPLVMICGMQDNKDAAGYLSPFSSLASGLFAVAADYERALSAEALAKAGEEAGVRSRACATLEEALRRACAQNTNEPPRLLIGGSLYLAGEVLRAHS